MSAARAPIKLGYWKIRGLAQPIRYLLAYAGVPFEDVLYEQGDDGNREAWGAALKKFVADGKLFPNVPWMEDGDVFLCQSSTILRYVARRYAPATYPAADAAVAAKIDEALDTLIDFRAECVSHYYRPGSSMTVFESKTADWLAEWNALLLKSEFVGGAVLSIADFAFAEVLEGVMLHCTECGTLSVAERYPRLAAYLQAFLALPAIAQYRASPACMARPFNNKSAQWK